MSSDVFLVDTERCIACRACEAACAREHGGTTRIFVTTVNEKHSVPLCCLHCERSPCVEACPTRALEKGSHAAVVFHKVRCIGCRLCIIACPFGVIELKDENTVLKCDRCLSRLKRGKSPACILTCPTRALVYGKHSTVTEKRRSKQAGKRKSKKTQGQH